MLAQRVGMTKCHIGVNNGPEAVRCFDIIGVGNGSGEWCVGWHACPDVCGDGDPIMVVVESADDGTNDGGFAERVVTHCNDVCGNFMYGCSLEGSSDDEDSKDGCTCDARSNDVGAVVESSYTIVVHLLVNMDAVQRCKPPNIFISGSNKT